MKENFFLLEAKKQKTPRKIKSNNFIQSNCATFSSCYSQAARNLGYSKHVYFGWNNQIYNTAN